MRKGTFIYLDSLKFVNDWKNSELVLYFTIYVLYLDECKHDCFMAVLD